MKASLYVSAIGVALCCTVNALFGQQISGQLTFGGNLNDVALSLSFSNNVESILVGAQSNSTISGDKTCSSFDNQLSDYWVVELNTNFVSDINLCFGGTGTDILGSTIFTENWYLGGTSNSPISGNKTALNKGEMDYWVIALSTSGEELWQQTFGGSDIDALTTMARLPDGNLLLGGVSSSPAGADRTDALIGLADFWLVKINPLGQKIWDRAYGGSGSQRLRTMTVLSDGRILMAGHSDSPISGDKTEACYGDIDGWLLMTDANGNKLWDRTIGGTGTDAIVALAISDGHIYAGAYSNSPASGTKTQDFVPGSVWPGPKHDYWVTKLTFDGNIVWDRTYGSSENDNLAAMIAADGHLYLAGESGGGVSGTKTEPSKGGLDYWLVKIDTTGAVAWDKTIGGPGMDQPYALTATYGKILIGGGSNSDAGGDKEEDSRGYSDIWIVSLDISSGVADQLSMNNAQLSIWPNPTHGPATLQYDMKSQGPLQWQVCDMAGRVVHTQSLQGTQGRAMLGISLPSGVYVSNVLANGVRIGSTRLVVLF